jgi:phosphate:Na+ symporter
MMEVLFNAIGGLALFILAMVMMTGGLKVFIGTRLKHLLQKWTSNPLRGVVSGAFITAIVQSSSAVTVATIGFVNAGVLTLYQALGVIFGANVGTTITGWLVSLVGFGVKIELFAMPILATGVLFRLLSYRKKFQALGEALTGVGLFFLGLAVLKDAFSGLAENVGTELLMSSDMSGLFSFILIGFVATFLTQSSSAAIAIILMAASQNIIGLNAAAAAIIGANIGTTSTAALAALNATPNARRVAAGHVTFNIVTGIVALMCLPMLLWMSSEFSSIGSVKHNTVSLLALFHTVFNIFGVLIMLPFIGHLSRALEPMFKTADEGLEVPKFLDKSVAKNPALATSAVSKELNRLNNLICSSILVIISPSHTKQRAVENKSESISLLAQSIHEFITTVRMEDMPRDVAEDIAIMLRLRRYLEGAAELIPLTNDLHELRLSIKAKNINDLLDPVFEKAEMVVNLFNDENEHHDQAVLAMDKFETSYQEAKSGVLKAAASKKLSPDRAENLLDNLSHTRRMLEQMFKADNLLRKYQLDNPDRQ